MSITVSTWFKDCIVISRTVGSWVWIRSTYEYRYGRCFLFLCWFMWVETLLGLASLSRSIARHLVEGLKTCKYSARSKLYMSWRWWDDHHHLQQLYGLCLVICSNSKLLMKLWIRSTFGTTPWSGDQPDSRYLPPQNSITQKDGNKRALFGIQTHDPKYGLMRYRLIFYVLFIHNKIYKTA